MALEGELQVGLRLAGGRVAAVAIQSTRPDVAHSLLRGRTRAEVVAAVPQIFALCARSQATASALACDAAAGRLPDADTLAQARRAVAAEVLREAAWHTLLQWPRWLGEKPQPDALLAARLAGGTMPDADPDKMKAIALAVLGQDAAQWLSIDTPAALTAWALAGANASARFVAHTAAQDADQPATLPPVPLLPADGHDNWVGDLAAAAGASPAFARQPVWHGQPAETGALARRQHDPLIQALLQGCAGRMTARVVARLQELAILLTGRAQPAVGAMTLPGGAGLAWVENARGLLLHQAVLQADRVLAYRIVAPTEWNFHAQGALTQALLHTPAADPAALQRHAQCLIHCLDPCVACQVECSDA